MPKYIVCLVDAYTREIIETEDEVFDNEGDAEAYSLECGSAFSEGAEVWLWLDVNSYLVRM